MDSSSYTTESHRHRFWREVFALARSSRGDIEGAIKEANTALAAYDKVDLQPPKEGA